MCGAELKRLSEGVQRVARALLNKKKGHLLAPRLLDQTARTAQHATDVPLSRGAQ
ncbi:MAG: hypothetical protein ABJB17_00660 [Burkholderiales bacterium]